MGYDYHVSLHSSDQLNFIRTYMTHITVFPDIKIWCCHDIDSLIKESVVFDDTNVLDGALARSAIIF